MIFTTAVLVVISLAASDARALHPASAADVKTIQTLLNKANLIQVDVTRQEKKLTAAEAALKNKPNDPILRGKVSYVAEILKDFVRERDLVRDKAIHRALTAFGIVPVDGNSGMPKMPSGTSVATDYNGQIAHWRVVAQDDTNRINLDALGNPIRVGPINIPDARAYTDGSGITIMYAKSFASPEYLALILSHEKEHFEQYTTKGRADKLSVNEREVEAWLKTEREAPILGLNVNDPTINATNTRAAFEKAVASDKWKQKWSGGLWKPKGIAQATPRTPSEVADVGRRFDDLSEVVAQEIKFAREEAASQRRAQDEIAHRDHDARLKTTIADLALRSCANPGSVTQAELDVLPRPYNENFHYGNLPSGLEGADGTGYCTEPFTYMAMGAGRRLDAEEVKRLSTPIVAVQPVPVPRAPAPIQSVPIRTNSTTILAIRYVSQQACATPPQPFDRELAWIPWSEFRHVTDAQAQERGLSACALRVYRRLVDFGQSWQPGQTIGPDAVRAAAAEPWSGFKGGGGGSSSPTDCILGDNSRRNCIACGNRYCD